MLVVFVRGTNDDVTLPGDGADPGDTGCMACQHLRSDAGEYEDGCQRCAGAARCGNGSVAHQHLRSDGGKYKGYSEHLCSGGNVRGGAPGCGPVESSGQTLGQHHTQGFECLSDVRMRLPKQRRSVERHSAFELDITN